MSLRSRSDQECRQTMTPFTASSLMTRRADLMLEASTNSIPDACNSDCVPQNWALRLVMANTFLCFKS